MKENGMRSGLVFLIMVSLRFACVAQWQTTVLPVGDGDSPKDPAVVINKKNPLNFVVAASPGLFWVTRDGGKTWTAKSPFSEETSIVGGHLLESDRKGILYNLCLTSGESQKAADAIMVQQSKDDGQTWEPLGRVTSPGTAELLRLGINTKGNEVMLTWTSCVGGEGFLMLSRSKDGKKWSEPIKMNVSPGDCVEGAPKGAGAVVSTDGYFVVAWSAGEKIHLDRSLDKGGFWLTNDIEVGEQVGGWAIDVPGWSGAAGFPELKIDNSAGRYNGSLFLVWADQRNENTSSIWFRRSVNFGDNWSPAIQLHETNDGYRFAPAMVVDQSSGHVFVLYYHVNEDGNTDVHLAWSVDNGNAFSFTKISENVFSAGDTLDMGQTISIDAHQGVITPVWTIVKDGRPAIATTTIQLKELKKDQPTAESK